MRNRRLGGSYSAHATVGVAPRRSVFEVRPAGTRERSMIGGLYPIIPGDPTGRSSHDGEGNGSIWSQDGEVEMLWAGLQLVRDKSTGDEATLLVEDGHGRRALFELFPQIPGDDLIDRIPGAFAALPGGHGSLEMRVRGGEWVGRRLE